MTKEILELMEEVSAEEIQELEGKGKRFNGAQCAWMLVSCTGFGCGGPANCGYYKKYCK
ncbi:hypothetical protein PJ311_10720 [Bacillus sp. CLL-7-23]|uniref:Lantibiotic n=1 Tax=Bacillus changyiensis TaxID=3004103 RepID=A0ABT4X6P5_9BACI|nr:sublancin family glycopeptide [Bacillus changyiensis]MDA7027081.1 hypothetical protein [Bacillus changyiensis]